MSIYLSSASSVMTLKWFLQNGRDVHFNGFRRQQLAVEKLIGGKLPRELADHDYYFKLASGECIYVSQPYASKDDCENFVQRWANVQGVKAVVYDGTHSWYYPCLPEDADKVCVIVVSLVDRDVVMP